MPNALPSPAEEVEVKRALRAGRPAIEIAAALNLSRSTVERIRDGYQALIVGERRDWPRGPGNVWWGNDVGCLPYGVDPPAGSIVARAWAAGLEAIRNAWALNPDVVALDEWADKPWPSTLRPIIGDDLLDASGPRADAQREEAMQAFRAALEGERARLLYVRALAERVVAAVEHERTRSPAFEARGLRERTLEAVESILRAEVKS